MITKKIVYELFKDNSFYQEQTKKIRKCLVGFIFQIIQNVFKDTKKKTNKKKNESHLKL